MRRTLLAVLGLSLLLPFSALAEDEDILQAYEEVRVIQRSSVTNVSNVVTSSSNGASTTHASSPSRIGIVGNQIQTLFKASSQQARQVASNRALAPRARRLALHTIFKNTHDSAMNIIRNLR
jgi:hypothetical protein